MRTIVHSLRRHPSISSLSLSSCNIDDNSLEYITFLLKSNRNILSLDLSSNSITAEGLDFIFTALRSGAGKQIISLDLSYNKLDSIGIIKLSKALESNQLPNLKHLILREVGGSDESLETLLNSIQQDSLLETLDISGNPLQPYKYKGKEKSASSYTSISKDMTKMLSTITKSKALQDMSNQVTGLFSQIGSDFTKKTKKRKYLSLPPPPPPSSSSSKNKLKASKNNKKVSKKLYKVTTPSSSDSSNDDAKISKKTAKVIINFVAKSPRLKSLGLMKSGITKATCLQIKKIVLKKNSSSSSNDINTILDMNDIDNMTINDTQISLKSL
jgi:hypothetical protein